MTLDYTMQFKGKKKNWTSSKLNFFVLQRTYQENEKANYRRNIFENYNKRLVSRIYKEIL